MGVGGLWANIRIVPVPILPALLKFGPSFPRSRGRFFVLRNEGGPARPLGQTTLPDDERAIGNWDAAGDKRPHIDSCHFSAGIVPCHTFFLFAQSTIVP